MTWQTLGALAAVPLLAGAAAVPASEPGKVTREVFTAGARQVSYYVYVPTTANPKTPLPVLVTFHGPGRNGQQLVEAWRTLAEREGIILIGPDAASSQAWRLPVDGPETLCALVDHVRKTQIVNPRRLYLFGHSSGGVFAIQMSILESSYFAAGAAHAAALRTPAEFKALDLWTRRIPIGIWIGDRDGYFPLTVVTPTIDALRVRGIPMKYEVLKGHDHNYQAVASKVNESVWEFLKGHALTADPVFTPHQF